MDTEIIRIINKALDGGLLDKKEIMALLSVENLSPEAFAIQQAGRCIPPRSVIKGQRHVLRLCRNFGRC